MASKKKVGKTSPPQSGSDIPLAELRMALISVCKEGSTENDKTFFNSKFAKYLSQEILKFPCSSEYNLLFLLDNTTIVKSDSDQLYRAITRFSTENKKPLLLVILSRGGSPGPAYLIGKLCREYSNGKFIAIVPRYAKSAATLIACGADEIHMGSLSELGPIDPQIDERPALGLKNSIEQISEMVSNQPASAEMFARYLHRTIPPVEIGYYERVAKSAVQYAERLLNGHKGTFTGKAYDIAYKLVYGYQDHGFVIDKAEAKEIFGDRMIKSNTAEYELGNAVYSCFSNLEGLAEALNHNFYFIGTLDSPPTLYRRPKK